MASDFRCAPSVPRPVNQVERRVGADFRQIEWDASVEDDCRQLVRLAIREDLGRLYDWTTVALVPEAAARPAPLSGAAAGRDRRHSGRATGAGRI